MKTLLYYLLILFVFAFSSCTPETGEVDATGDSASTTNEITSFSFLAANNANLTTDVVGTISGADITLTVPFGTDVTELIPTFVHTGEGVKVGVFAQVSGETDYDYSEIVMFGVKSGTEKLAYYFISVLAPTGFTVSGVSNDVTEAGTTATFTVSLAFEPDQDVEIPLTVSAEAEIIADATSLIFTSLNWNSPQTVTILGVDDNLIDGDQTVEIYLNPVVTTGVLFAGLNPPDLSIVNADDDTAAFTINGVTGSATEAGGEASFTMSLVTKPDADVTVSVSLPDATELTSSVTELVFTPVNWNGVHTVTLTGVDDDLIDGDQSVTVTLGAATTEDENYTGLNPADVTVINSDDDTAGFIISTVVGTPTESAGTGVFTVKLNATPDADVSIPITLSDATEITSSTNLLTFTTANWNSLQAVTITGVDDAIADGDQVATVTLGIVSTTGSLYTGLNPNDVVVTNTDDDTAGITVTTPASGTTEAGQGTSFTIKLNSEPTFDVSIGVTSSDTSEATTSPISVTFTAANWATAQTINVSAVDDFLADGDQGYNIVIAAATSSDSGYAGMNPADLPLINTDNDTAGFTISTMSNNTTEGLGTATFTMRLNAQPSADVTTAVTTSDVTEGTPSVSTLVFTNANWNTNQMVTVTGVNDDVVDGAQAYTILLGAASSTDLAYDTLDPSNVAAINDDDDSAGVILSTIAGTPDEQGATATFTVTLNSEPTGNVIIGLSSNDIGEGTVSPTSITFTAVDWSLSQTITITGLEDNLEDGNQLYNILLAPATGTDTTGYVGLDPSDVATSTTDNGVIDYTSCLHAKTRATTIGGVYTAGALTIKPPSGGIYSLYCDLNGWTLVSKLLATSRLHVNVAEVTATALNNLTFDLVAKLSDVTINSLVTSATGTTQTYKFDCGANIKYYKAFTWNSTSNGPFTYDISGDNTTWVTGYSTTGNVAWAGIDSFNYSVFTGVAADEQEWATAANGCVISTGSQNGLLWVQ